MSGPLPSPSTKMDYFNVVEMLRCVNLLPPGCRPPRLHPLGWRGVPPAHRGRAGDYNEPEPMGLFFDVT